MGGDNKAVQFSKEQLAAIQSFLAPYQQALNLPKLQQTIQSGGQGGAVLPLDTAVSMARNQAATIGNNEAVAANRAQLQREGAQTTYSNLPGSPTKAFADTIAQNVSAAGNETALNQQNLQLENLKTAISPLQGIIQTLFGGYGGVAETGTSNANYNWLTGSSGFIPGIANAAGAFGKSDRVLKENIKKLGKFGPLNVYEYDIEGRREAGVMAQEARTVIPEAVIKMPEGYLMVNYRKLRELVAHA